MTPTVRDLSTVSGMQVTVLGAGSWGTTTAALLATRHPTVLWARSPETAAEIDGRHTNDAYLPGFMLPDRLLATDDLEKAMRHAELLIVGVPTTAMRSTLHMAREWIHPWIPIVSLSKGLEQGSLLRMTEVIADEIPGHPVAALTGPNIAREIMAGQAAASVIATEDLSVANALQRVLRRGMFRIYTNHDVIGFEVGGALKNVVAIAAGVAQGLGVGDNARAALITRGLAELTRLGLALGGNPLSFLGLAGIGDLVVTCTSEKSRNRHVGVELGRGRSLPEILGEMHMVAEGVRSTASVLALAERSGVEMPIAAQVQAVLAGERRPSEALAALMGRVAKSELEGIHIVP
ncbi:MAG: NAD(P)H-dependent glycerol-3-phosphate dehydrogenase [Acidimicrobiia bacterium]